MDFHIFVYNNIYKKYNLDRNVPLSLDIIISIFTYFEWIFSRY